jgi:hypothetical protein
MGDALLGVQNKAYVQQRGMLDLLEQGDKLKIAILVKSCVPRSALEAET